MPTVLLVDDEADILDGVAATLKQRGLTVLTADTGRTALDLIQSARPDVVVLDLSMPDVDGLEVLEQLQEWPDLAGMPVLVYSAVADDDGVRHAAVRLGAVEFLTKGTVTWDELADRVLRHLPVAR